MSGAFSSAKSDEARREIMQRIARASGPGPGAAGREAIETYLRAHPRGPLRPFDGDPVERFVANAVSLQSTCSMVDAEREVPRAAADYLRALGLPLAGCVWPQLAHLDWGGAGFALEPRGANGDDAVGVTGAFAALAETGTLMLVSGTDTPATASLLPETHIAVLRASRIVACMEDAWDLARRAFGTLPRAVNFVSGPSRTGDIEQKMVLGAHGPYRVHIVLVRRA